MVGAKFSSKRRWGIGLLVGPFLTLVLDLILYSVVTFIFSRVSSGNPVGFQIISVILSLIGVLAVIGIIVGIPVGIILIVLDSRKKPEMPQADNNLNQ